MSFPGYERDLSPPDYHPCQNCGREDYGPNPCTCPEDDPNEDGYCPTCGKEWGYDCTKPNEEGLSSITRFCWRCGEAPGDAEDGKENTETIP